MSPAMAGALLLCAAFFWGAGNVANKTVLEHVGPLTAVCLRCLIAVLVILPLALRETRAHGGPGADRAWLPGAVTVSLFFAAALALQQIAYLTTTVTNASFLVNTAGILTPILAWTLFGDRPGLRIIIAAPLTLLGAFLMAGATFRLSALNPGDIACLGSALCYAAWMVALGRHAVAHGRPFATTVLQFSVTGLVLLPLAAGMETTTLAGVQAALPELLLLGVFSTAVAFAIQTYAQRFVSSSTAAILVSAESLFGAAGAVLLLGEVTPLTGLVGAALILGAIVLVALGTRGPPPAAA
jgi:drug/metabolite transporter (DMT)-like permease